MKTTLFNSTSQPILRKAQKIELSHLIKIFEENYVKNGGTLYSFCHMPNEENLNQIYVLDFLGEAVAYVHLNLPNTVYPTMEATDLIIPISFKQFIYIKQCAVGKAHQGKGYGTKMYQELFKQWPDRHFFAHVSVKNEGSLKLHRKMGFVPIGNYFSDCYQGIPGDYHSYLFYREKSEETLKNVG